MRELVVDIGLNDAVLADEHANLVSVLELIDLGEIIEQRVVPRVDVIQILTERDVEDGSLSHRIVETDLNEKCSLADAGARHDHAEVPRAQTTMGRALQDSEGAVFVDFLAKHLKASYFAFTFSFSRAFSISSCSIASGSGT